MRRYQHLSKTDEYEAVDSLRDAFLAAKNGNEVTAIIDALMTQEEQLKLGRRILIAACLRTNMTHKEISKLLKVAQNTISNVQKHLSKYEAGFLLIEKRRIYLEKEFQQKKYKRIGASKLVKKPRVYTGLKRKDVAR